MDRNKKLRRLLLIGVSVFVICACVPLLWQLFWKTPGRIDFMLHKTEYEHLVQAVKKENLSPGTSSKTLHIADKTVWARRSEEGRYTITILTADWGHLGMAGYVYADMPPDRITGDPYANVDAPGDLWTLGEQINSHWWTVFNNLK